MLRSFGVLALALGSLAPTASYGYVNHHRTHRSVYRYNNERHPVRKTVKRVGLGAAGGAAVGALAGGAPGAAIGAVAGGGAGAIYDHHEKKIGK